MARVGEYQHKGQAGCVQHGRSPSPVFPMTRPSVGFFIYNARKLGVTRVSSRELYLEDAEIEERVELLTRHVDKIPARNYGLSWGDTIRETAKA